MRVQERIPIVLDFFRGNPAQLSMFLFNTKLEKSPELTKEFENFWLDNQDLRLGQALINYGVVSDQSSWHKEEPKWLIDHKYLKPEDILFWGNTQNKDGSKLTRVEYKLLRDLHSNHIQNIIKFCSDNNQKLHPDYLEYFETRVKQIKKKIKMNKNEVTTAEDLEKYYSICRKIRFDEDFVINPETLFYDIVNQLFIQQVATKTIRLKHQCDRNRRRSLDDFIKIVKYYIPNMTVSEILKTYKKMFMSENTIGFKKGDCTKYIYLSYCNQIRKSNIWDTPSLNQAISANKNHFKYNWLHSGFLNLNLTYDDI